MDVNGESKASYGQNRVFAGLEKIAIRQRVKVAETVIRRLSAANPALNVLELGCGFHGANLKYLKTRFPEAHFSGVDLQIDRSSSGKDGIELIEAALDDWRPPATYDCVLSLAVAEHLVAVQKHFDLVAASLSSGLAVMTTPTPQAHVVLQVLSGLGIFDKDACDDHKLYLTRFGIEMLASRSSLKAMEYHSTSAGLNQWCTLARETT